MTQQGYHTPTQDEPDFPPMTPEEQAAYVAMFREAYPEIAPGWHLAVSSPADNWSMAWRGTLLHPDGKTQELWGDPIAALLELANDIIEGKS